MNYNEMVRNIALYIDSLNYLFIIALLIIMICICRPKSRTNTSTSIGINITAAGMCVTMLIAFKNVFIIEKMNRVYMGTIKTNVIWIIII